MSEQRYQITRRLPGFDTGHRLQAHEGKCRNYHGHRYSLEVTCSMAGLDSVGRVVDFSVVKARVGGWIDQHLDHGMVLQRGDPMIRTLVELKLEAMRARRAQAVELVEGIEAIVAKRVFQNEPKLLVVDFPPTAERLAEFLYHKATELMAGTGVEVDVVRLFETPDAWADFPPAVTTRHIQAAVTAVETASREVQVALLDDAKLRLAVPPTQVQLTPEITPEAWAALHASMNREDGSQ